MSAGLSRETAPTNTDRGRAVKGPKRPAKGQRKPDLAAAAQPALVGLDEPPQALDRLEDPVRQLGQRDLLLLELGLLATATATPARLRTATPALETEGAPFHLG